MPVVVDVHGALINERHNEAIRSGVVCICHVAGAWASVPAIALLLRMEVKVEQRCISRIKHVLRRLEAAIVQAHSRRKLPDVETTLLVQIYDTAVLRRLICMVSVCETEEVGSNLRQCQRFLRDAHRHEISPSQRLTMCSKPMIQLLPGEKTRFKFAEVTLPNQAGFHIGIQGRLTQFEEFRPVSSGCGKNREVAYLQITASLRRERTSRSGSGIPAAPSARVTELLNPEHFLAIPWNCSEGGDGFVKPLRRDIAFRWLLRHHCDELIPLPQPVQEIPAPESKSLL